MGRVVSEHVLSLGLLSGCGLSPEGLLHSNVVFHLFGFCVELVITRKTFLIFEGLFIPLVVRVRVIGRLAKSAILHHRVGEGWLFHAHCGSAVVLVLILRDF